MSQEKEVRKDERNLFTFLIVFLLVKTKKRNTDYPTENKKNETETRNNFRFFSSDSTFLGCAVFFFTFPTHFFEENPNKRLKGGGEERKKRKEREREEHSVFQFVH